MHFCVSCRAPKYTFCIFLALLSIIFNILYAMLNICEINSPDCEFMCFSVVGSFVITVKFTKSMDFIWTECWFGGSPPLCLSLFLSLSLPSPLPNFSFCSSRKKGEIWILEHLKSEQEKLSSWGLGTREGIYPRPGEGPCLVGEFWARTMMQLFLLSLVYPLEIK